MSEALLRRRRLMMMLLQGGGGLPDGYQELQWVASNGVRGNVVDTLISAPSGVFVVGRVSFQNVSGYQVNGAEDASPYARNYPIGVASGGQWYLGADGYWTSGSVVWGQAYDIEASTLIGDIHLNVDGVSVIRQTAGNDRSAKNLYLFGSNGYNNVTKMTIYGHLFYYADSDRSHLIAEFVPCKRKSDDAVGLYDIKRGIFLLPASVALTAGPDVGVYSDGVYVQASDGKLYTREEWTGQTTPIGVAVLQGDKRFVIKYGASQQITRNMFTWDGYDQITALTLNDGVETTQKLVDKVKASPYWGEREWQTIYDNFKSMGIDVYIPSLSEVSILQDLRTQINPLLTIAGITNYSTNAWTSVGSTSYSSRSIYRFQTNGFGSAYADNNNYLFLLEKFD